jgi:hypothetical protein
MGFENELSKMGNILRKYSVAMRKNIAIMVVIIVAGMLVLNQGAVFAGPARIAAYSPPFEIYGIVKEVKPDCLEVFIPHINKQITVMVSPGTSIINRIDKHTPRILSAINVEDLVVIKGIVDKESFFSKEISYLPMAE